MSDLFKEMYMRKKEISEKIKENRKAGKKNKFLDDNEINTLIEERNELRKKINYERRKIYTREYNREYYRKNPDISHEAYLKRKDDKLETVRAWNESAVKVYCDVCKKEFKSSTKDLVGHKRGKPHREMLQKLENQNNNQENNKQENPVDSPE